MTRRTSCRPSAAPSPACPPSPRRRPPPRPTDPAAAPPGPAIPDRLRGNGRRRSGVDCGARRRICGRWPSASRAPWRAAASRGSCYSSTRIPATASRPSWAVGCRCGAAPSPTCRARWSTGSGRAGSTGSWWMDADLSPPARAHPRPAGGARRRRDMVVGSRYVPGASTAGEWGRARALNSRVATLLVAPVAACADPMGRVLRRRPPRPAALGDPAADRLQDRPRADGARPAAGPGCGRFARERVKCPVALPAVGGSGHRRIHVLAADKLPYRHGYREIVRGVPENTAV